MTDMQSRDPRQASPSQGQPAGVGGSDASAGFGEWSADELIPFGKYMLLDRITGGATSALYRANVRGEAGFERLVAIKRILPHMAGDPEFVKTFVREAKTVARLTHSNICPIYELGKVGESLYMAIEYIAGKDLGRITRALARRNEVMPPVIAAFIAARVCDALDYAHHLRNSTGENAGVVHRDLSPTNVLVSYEGMVKLIDFGLAKAVGRAQQTNVDALKQKLGYMSPEMVKGRPIDSRSDIFGVGVLLYEMLTGRRLFAGKDDIDTLKRVGRASVPPPSAVSEDVPDDLEVVVMRALERDPADRWQTAGEMGQTLNAYVQRTAPHFNTQRLSEWIIELFQEQLADENAHVKKLLAASSDAELVKRRRDFFASPSGAAARARAEIRRRVATDPPVPPRPPHAAALKPAPVPAEAKRAQADEEVTSFYDQDRTVAAPLAGPSSERTVAAPAPMGVFSAETRRASSPLLERRSGGFDDEPTHFVVSQLPPPGGGEPPDPLTGGFEDEATHFLADLEEVAPRVPARDMGGFEDEPTHIFFNKEEGIGVPSLLDEINDVQEGAGKLNRPIIAPDLMAAAAPAPKPAPALQAPPALGRPRLPTPAPSAVQVAPTQRVSEPTPSVPPRRASNPTPVPPMPAALQAPPPLAAPAPMAPPPAMPVFAVPASSARNTGTFAMSALPQQAKPGGMPTWLVVLAVVLLSGTIGALVVATPVGVALGLRTPQVGSIEVRTEPATRAEIMLDGVYRGRAPLRLDRVQVGQHSIEARATSYLPTTRAVSVSASQTLLLHLPLEADPGAAR